jgi:hypothetical protein
MRTTIIAFSNVSARDDRGAYEIFFLLLFVYVTALLLQDVESDASSL